MIVFGDDGKKVLKDEHDRKNYLKTLERDVGVIAESDMDQSSQESGYLDKVRSAMKQNKSLDDQTAKDRLKKKRIKAKAKLRKAEGIPDKDAFTLGSESEQDSK